MLLADKLIGHIIPARFALFAMIGAFGLLVHLANVWISLRLVGLGFAPAQSVATIVAMTSNFFFNNQFTYRDQRLSGSPARGLLIFYLICGVGAVANVGVASYAFTSSHTWWLGRRGRCHRRLGVELCHVFGLYLAPGIAGFAARRSRLFF